MDCINSPPAVIIHSMKSFKKESRKNLALKKSEDSDDNDSSSYDDIEDDTSHSSEQSKIPIKAKMENNELIFL